MACEIEVLAAAARSAGYAPSIHNTQPWRWRVGRTADPDHAGPPHTPRLPADQVVEVSEP